MRYRPNSSQSVLNALNKGLSSITIVKHSRNLSEPCKLWPGRIFEFYTPPGFLGVPNASSQSVLSFGIALQAPQCANKGLSSITIVKHSRNLSEPCKLWPGRIFEFYTPPGFLGVPNSSSQSVLSFGIALQAPQCANKGLSSITIVKHSRNLSEPCKLWPGRIFEFYTPPGFLGVPNSSSQSVLSFGIALQAPQCANKGLSSITIVKHSRNLSQPCKLWPGRIFEFYTPPGFLGVPNASSQSILSFGIAL